MARFLYRMQNILNIKQKMEEQAKMEYGFARVRLTEEEKKLEALSGRKAGYEREVKRLLLDHLELRKIMENQEAVLRMDEFIALQKQEVAKAERHLEQQRQKLQTAIQERKVQEKLREHAFEDFLQEEKARESKEIDELTSYTYGQKNREENKNQATESIR